MTDARHTSPVALPRVTITYCTQCKWMLRAAYFGQELLSTFGNSIGEIALIPATGGFFQVKLTYKPPQTDDGEQAQVQEVLLWDRKTEGGFPETKVLKQLLRNYIEPGKDLGHSDKPSMNSKTKSNTTENGGANAGHGSDDIHAAEPKIDTAPEAPEKDCEDCK